VATALLFLLTPAGATGKLTSSTVACRDVHADTSWLA
jgi:hypothetical protein